MREVTLDELYTLVSNSRERIKAKSYAPTGEPKVYLHWSAGRYNHAHKDYHVNIAGNGKILIPYDDFSTTTAGTWRRNSGSVNISILGCYDATSNSLGSEPPTEIQIETMAKCVDVVADALWLTINKTNVLTHGEAADNEDGWYAHEPYGPKNGCERWVTIALIAA